MKTENLMKILQNRARGLNVVHTKDTNVKRNMELKNKSRRGLSKSTTGLNNIAPVGKEKSLTKSTSCSVLNTPLPSEPSKRERSVSIYDDNFQVSVMLEENTAYATTNPNVSVTAMADKFNKETIQEKAGMSTARDKTIGAVATQEKDHLYEQL